MVYVRSSSIGCYHVKINTPKRFKDDKKWKKAKDKEYDEKMME